MSGAGDKRFFLHTLGCKVNWCDSDTLARTARTQGWRQTRHAADAAVCVVNTCTVTGHADATARKVIRALQRENPAAPVIVTGCYARTDAGVLERLVEGARIVAGAQPQQTLALMESLVRSRPAQGGAASAAEAEPAAGRTRAFIKIQDGCDQWCAYCKVPAARGPARSVPLPTVLDLMRARAAESYQEVVLTGVNLAVYRDNNDTLADVVRAVAALQCMPRIRLSSVEASAVDDKLLAVFAEFPALMPHLHLPLQSGSARLLERMHRPVTRAVFLDAARAFHAYHRDAVITTDVLVGFPGETDSDVDATIEVIEELTFGKVHVFPFSVRAGTAAARMAGQIAPAVIRAREERVMAAAHGAAARCRARFAAAPLAVLVEQRRRGWWEGFSHNYLRVRSRRGDLQHGQIAQLIVNKDDTQFIEP